MELFEKELRTLINIHSKEGGSNTPDFVLAAYLNACLNTYTKTVSRRDIFEGRDKKPDDHVPDLPASRHPAHPVPRGADDQLTQCMPAELRTRLEDHDPRSPRLTDIPFKPVKMFLRSFCGVEGHLPECLIDLDVNYHACTCGAG